MICRTTEDVNNLIDTVNKLEKLVKDLQQDAVSTGELLKQHDQEINTLIDAVFLQVADSDE